MSLEFPIDAGDDKNNAIHGYNIAIENMKMLVWDLILLKHLNIKMLEHMNKIILEHVQTNVVDPNKIINKVSKLKGPLLKSMKKRTCHDPNLHLTITSTKTT